MTKHTSAAPLEIAIAIYPDAWRSAVYGFTDLLQVAERYALEDNDAAPRLRITHWQLVDGQVGKVFDTHQASGVETSQPAAIMLPPAIGELPSGARMGNFAAWLKARHAGGAILCSACGGASLLAETGLLDGRSATTHWLHGDMIARRHPNIHIDTDKILLDEGDIITAGGMMAWTDLGLRLVDRLLGTRAMLATARFMLIDPGARAQSFYSKFIPRLDHGDTVILKIQHWLHGADLKGLTLAAMAERAGLGERTFLRRFHKATGHNPTDYSQRLRIAKARDLLEQSQMPIDQIAWQSGYEDANAFRKTFRKILGLTPGEYRMRFSLAGARGT